MRDILFFFSGDCFAWLNKFDTFIPQQTDLFFFDDVSALVQEASSSLEDSVVRAGVIFAQRSGGPHTCTWACDFILKEFLFPSLVPFI